MKSEKQKGSSAKLKAARKKPDKHIGVGMQRDISRPASATKETPGFYYRVYAIVEQIPKGKVTTYGAIAELVGMKGSSRMVGQALGALPPDSDVPAQRVINRIGALSGAHHFGGYDRMRSLLVKEGVSFKGEIVDMNKHFWDPREASH